MKLNETIQLIDPTIDLHNHNKIYVSRDKHNLLEYYKKGMTKEHKLKISNHRKELLKDKTKNPMYGKKHTDETKKKISKKNKGNICYFKGMNKKNNPEIITWGLKGKLHPNWNGGITIYRNLIEIKECSLCKKNQNLEVHHIDKNRHNNNLNNLQVLCCSCHAKIHKKGKYLPKNLLRNKKGQFIGGNKNDCKNRYKNKYEREN